MLFTTKDKVATGLLVAAVAVYVGYLITGGFLFVQTYAGWLRSGSCSASSAAASVAATTSFTCVPHGLGNRVHRARLHRAVH